MITQLATGPYRGLVGVLLALAVGAGIIGLWLGDAPLAWAIIPVLLLQPVTRDNRFRRLAHGLIAIWVGLLIGSLWMFDRWPELEGVVSGAVLIWAIGVPRDHAA